MIAATAMATAMSLSSVAVITRALRLRCVGLSGGNMGSRATRVPMSVDAKGIVGAACGASARGRMHEKRPVK